MLKSRNNLWRPENSSFCIKMTLTFLPKMKIPPMPPLKCRLWEELQTLGSCWAGLSETECDGISEDWKTFRIYTSECCQNALLSASYKKKTCWQRGKCARRVFFFFSPSRSVFWCHLSTAVGEVVAFKVRNIQSHIIFQTVFLEQGHLARLRERLRGVSIDQKCRWLAEKYGSR